MTEFVQFLNPQTGDPELVPASMAKDYTSRFQGMIRRFDDDDDDDDDDDGESGSAGICPIAGRRCPESNDCVYWTSHTDDEGEEVEECLELVRVASETEANEAREEFFRKATELLTDVRGGDASASPLGRLLARFDSWLAFDFEAKAAQISGGYVDSDKAAKPVVDAKSAMDEIERNLEAAGK